jgi:hypothetical protein
VQSFVCVIEAICAGAANTGASVTSPLICHMFTAAFFASACFEHIHMMNSANPPDTMYHSYESRSPIDILALATVDRHNTDGTGRGMDSTSGEGGYGTVMAIRHDTAIDNDGNNSSTNKDPGSSLAANDALDGSGVVATTTPAAARYVNTVVTNSYNVHMS